MNHDSNQSSTAFGWMVFSSCSASCAQIGSQMNTDQTTTAVSLSLSRSLSLPSADGARRELPPPLQGEQLLPVVPLKGSHHRHCEAQQALQASRPREHRELYAYCHEYVLNLTEILLPSNGRHQVTEYAAVGSSFFASRSSMPMNSLQHFTNLGMLTYRALSSCTSHMRRNSFQTRPQATTRRMTTGRNKHVDAQSA